MTDGGWRAAGMQALVEAVRSTHATQPILFEGLHWGGELSQWLAFAPRDPAQQLVASVHIYNLSRCHTVACWSDTIAPVARRIPVVTGELGSRGCSQGFIMSCADAHRVSYLAWSWNTASCSGGPPLISSYDGAPAPFGVGPEAHLAHVATTG